MAILKQLLVHGSSRFLNTIYANDLNVGGTTSFADLAVTGITNLAAGNNISASLQINSKGALYGYDAWLRINEQKQFTSGVYFGTNVVRTDGSFQIGSNGANILMNTSAATFKVPINMNGTTYKWDTSGNIVVKKITASSGLVDDLIVTNELRTFKWDIQHIANLGGSFLVTPTLNCTANSATFTVTAISGNTITAAIKDSTAITGNSLGGTTWPADSKIKISGKIGGIVLGTCDGKLTAAMNNTAGTLNIQFTYPDQATNPLAVQTYNAANVSNLTVMLTTVGATNPIGIYMTSYDTNGFSHISLYGGTATAPTVRIGNLQGLATINNVTPTGWGIYTNNGFFSGTVVSESGKIGGYTLDSTSLFSGTKGNSTTSGHFTLTTGTFSRAIDGTTRSNLQMALGAKFGVANDGTLYTNGANITNINASNIKTGTLSADRIAANSIQASKLSISDLQAIGATIGGFDIDSTSVHTNDVAVTSNADNSIALSSSDFTRTINGTSRAGLRFAIGDKFGVTGDGAIYASSATISGAITATSGTIGGCSIDTNGVLQVPAANITGQLTASQIDASGITIGQSQVTNLSTALGNKADATTVTALQNKVTAVYGTSSTAAATQIKDITCANFTLFTGARVTINFTKANTAASPKIKFNGQDDTDACAIWVNNASATTSNPILWTANTVLTFTYDGSVWVLENKPSTYNVNSNTPATTQSKTTTTPNGVLVLDGTIAVVSFSQSNTYVSNYLQLNFAGTGNAKIYLDSGATSATNTLLWSANTILTFTRDGGLWRLTNRSDASETATNYITYVNATDGIKVHSPSDTTNYAQLNSNGMFVYKDGSQVAKFGDTIILGKASRTHSEINSNGFIIKDYNQRNMTFIGTLNDVSGIAEIVEKQEIGQTTVQTDDGPIEGYSVILSSYCIQIITVKYNGTDITDQVQLYDNWEVYIKNATSSYDGKLLTIKYQTSTLTPVIRFGIENNCSSLYSGAFGSGNGVFGTCSYALGSGCTVIGDYSFAEGNGAYSRDNSHAEGLDTRAVNIAHAEGFSTLAQHHSHAEGQNTQATGYASHAEGEGCIARGDYSHASGRGTLAIGASQTVIGEYNTRDNSEIFAFIIGNGTASDDRHNAFAIEWNGTPRGQMVQHNAGTTFTLSAGVIPGFVTNNTVILTLTTERFLDIVSTITVSTLKGGLRGVQGFLDGSAYNTDWKTSAYTVSASKLSRRHIEIRIEKKNGNFTNIVTQSPVAFYVNPTLTLNFS